MSIFILTEGGKRIGLGHVSRCLAIAQALKERGEKAKFVLDGDRSASKLLNGMMRSIFNWHKDQDRILKMIKTSRAVIVDSYRASPELLKKISSNTLKPVYIDDTNRLHYPKGTVVNGTIGAENMHYPCKNGSRLLLGIKYFPLRKPFWSVKKRSIRKNIRNILITFGGTNCASLMIQVVRFLNNFYPYGACKIVARQDIDRIKDIKSTLKKGNNTIISPDDTGMKDLMLDSDIAISAGGQTLYELARTGTPSICVGIVDNQLFNVRGLKEAGFIEYAGWHDSPGLVKKIESALNRLSTARERMLRRDIGMRIIDGRGALRIADAILG